MKKLIKIGCMLLALITVLCLLGGCVSKDGGSVTTEAPSKAKSKTVAISSVNKHGNLMLNTTFDELKTIDIEVGDIITVTVAGKSYDMPVGNAYSDVDSGCMICRFDIEDNEVAVAVNNKAFATVAGIGEKVTITEDPGYRWDITVSEVTLTLKEKGGYQDELLVRALKRTNERSDYAALSDEDFANFRAVKVSGMKENFIYRSTTPIEPAIGRNTYAMQATEKAGIKSIINLDDDYATMIGYPTFANSYYSKCTITNIALPYDVTTDEFKARLKDCILFIIANDGPILIHCKEGKDRTGTSCAILEAFIGGTYEEIRDDYMKTYFNFYNIEKDGKAYNKILKTNLEKNLCDLFGVTDLKTADLKSEAKDLLKSIGLTDSEITSLENKLKA